MRVPDGTKDQNYPYMGSRFRRRVEKRSNGVCDQSKDRGVTTSLLTASSRDLDWLRGPTFRRWWVRPGFSLTKLRVGEPTVWVTVSAVLDACRSRLLDRFGSQVTINDPKAIRKPTRWIRTISLYLLILKRTVSKTPESAESL